MTFSVTFSTAILSILLHSHPDIKIEPLSMIVSNFISGMLGYISGYYMGKDKTTKTVTTETPCPTIDTHGTNKATETAGSIVTETPPSTTTKTPKKSSSVTVTDTTIVDKNC
jgi:hypothetical protein